MRNYEYAPGAVAASTATALGSDAPAFGIVTSVLVQTEAAGGTASTTSPVEATIVQSATGLGANDFYWDASTQKWQYGSATTDGTVFTIRGLTVAEVGYAA